MAGLGDMVQKAFYLGVGLATYAKEQATNVNLQELMNQAQKLADDMVARGEMTAEEARRYVDNLIQQAQQPNDLGGNETVDTAPKEPRPIEIVDESESQPEDKAAGLRKQVAALQDELRKLQQK
jgi:polyhydroxyalkanoate synthesis regulator phasin